MGVIGQTYWWYEMDKPRGVRKSDWTEAEARIISNQGAPRIIQIKNNDDSDYLIHKICNISSEHP